MASFLDLAKSLFNDYLAHPPGQPSWVERAEALCRQLGWAVDERSDDSLTLYFNDPPGIRKVTLTGGDTGRLLAFSIFSGAVASQKVRQDVLAHLLRRNGEMLLGAWQAWDGGAGKVLFGLKYCALAAGLDATAFRCLCEMLVKEASAFDAMLRQANLL